MMISRSLLFSLPLSAFAYSIGPLKSRQDVTQGQCQVGICILDLGPNSLEDIQCNTAAAADSNFAQDCQSIAGEAQDTLSAFTTSLAPIADTNLGRPNLGFSASSGSCQLQFVLDNSFINAQSQIVTDINSFEGVLQNITQATLNEGQACIGNVMRGSTIIGTACTSIASDSQRRSASIIDTTPNNRQVLRPRQTSPDVNINQIGPNILEDTQCVPIGGLSPDFPSDCMENLGSTLISLNNDFSTSIVPLPFQQNSRLCSLAFSVSNPNANEQAITDLDSFTNVFNELINLTVDNVGSVCTANVVNKQTNEIVGLLSVGQP